MRAPRSRGGGRAQGAALVAALTILAVVASAGPAPAQAPSAPVFAAQVPAGSGTAESLPARKDPRRRVDGDLSDWRGEPTRFGGSAIYSSGELIYQDHVFDAYGPDNGQDRDRLAVFDPLAEAVPELYRLDPAIQYVPGEFGIPTPGYDLSTHYGDLPRQDEADLSELRIGSDGDRNLWLVARTTTMTAPAKTALLVLLDTKGPDQARDVPFGSDIRSGRADRALLLSGKRGWSADLATGTIAELPAGSVAFDASGYANAIEARIPASALGGELPDAFSIAAATGLADPSGAVRLKDLGLGANLANVAFRTGEPARDYWDKQQAFALLDRTIDPFFHRVDMGPLRNGATQHYRPGAGYHDRLFRSSARISQERGEEGVIQHYGVYLPTAYRPDRPSPLQWWFHFRGGTAHIAAAAVPRIFKEMGEDHSTIVVTPRGRGTSTWYVGKGHVDYREVYLDVARSFNVDRDRTYISGHSMGGWATYLMTILYPDRFAAGFPASGPVTQGAWTGVDFPGCDDVVAPDGETPCYIEANGSDPRAQFTRPLLDNLRWVPQAIYHGAADELVPVSGVARQAERFQELGYRYRFYVFPGQEHYGPPIVDQWTEGARYEHQFVRDPNPPRVTYLRSMPFERATERVSSGGVPLSFDFDSAYWMSNLKPADQTNGMARFDGRSLAIPQQAYGVTPEVGGPAAPGQAGPYAMVGQAWQAAGRPPATTNGFDATLRGATGVQLDLPRMDIDARRTVTGAVETERTLRLSLHGPFGRRTRARVDGREVGVQANGYGATVTVPAGKHTVVLDQVDCVSRRSFVIRLPRVRRGDRLVRARVLVNGRQVRTLRGRRLRARVNLRGLPRGLFRVTVVARTRRGRTIRQTRRYRTCTARGAR